jgi:small subunit ribosomal protein S6
MSARERHAFPFAGPLIGRGGRLHGKEPRFMVSRFPRVRSYELMVIFHPETEDEALAELIGRVQTYISDADGTVTVLNRESPWGRRRLAYPIRHESRDLRDGIYVLFYFDVEASRTVDIEREIKLNTRIIRYMLIQQSTPTMEPPPPPEEAPALAEGQVTPSDSAVQEAPNLTSEVSRGTPAEALPTPLEPTVPESAGAPLAAEENITAPALDSPPEPSPPSETLPPADVSLVDTMSDSGSTAEQGATTTDLPIEEAPPEAADVADSAGPAAESPDLGEEPAPAKSS